MPEQPSLDEQNEVKKRAIRRVIIASVLAAAAIAALTVLTRHKSEAPVTRTTTQGTVLPPDAQPQPTAPAQEEMAIPPTTPPEQETQPATPPPPPPEVVNAPTAAEPVPQTTKPISTRPGTAAEVSARPAQVKPAAVQPQATTHAVQEMLPAQPAKSAAEKAPLPSKAAELTPKAYTVQLGVFSNPTNALQLQEKLAQNGIKSYTETRLNVGPFQSKTEADQALAKIRALGVSAVVVPAR